MNFSVFRACVLHEDSIVGSDTRVGVSSRIERSVVGKKCVIGKNVVIEDSFIWNGTVIEVIHLSIASFTCG